MPRKKVEENDSNIEEKSNPKTTKAKTIKASKVEDDKVSEKQAKATSSKASNTKATSEKPTKVTKAKDSKEKVEEKEVELPQYDCRKPILKDFDIIKNLITTEQTQKLRESDNALVFAVDKRANKLEIKSAVEAIFRAKVDSVNTQVIRPKKKRVGKYDGKVAGYKKAIVRFNSAFDLGKVAAQVAPDSMQANQESK